MTAPSRRRDGRAVEDPCLPALDPIDALRVGQALRELVASGKAPPGSAESCARVGNALVVAAHNKFRERKHRGDRP